MCLISACLGLCRPLGAFSVVATLPGVYTPVCGLSSLRDFRVSPLRLLFAKKADEKNLKGRGRNVPRTAIFSFKLDSALRVGRYCTLCRLILRALFRLAAWNVENDAVSSISQFGRICNPTVRSMGICNPKTHEKDISFYCSPEKSAEGAYLADTNNNK